MCLEKKNYILNIIATALGAILVCASLVFAVSLGINIALAPVAASLKEVGALSGKVASLERELAELKKRPAERPMPPQQPPAEDMNKVYDLPVADSFILGKADAKVTIMEFSDLQCPYCSRFHAPMKEALGAFPNDVKIVLKNYPLSFHPNARPAAKAALAAGIQGKYYEMIDLLFANNKDLSDAKYVELAGKLGLNVAQFSKDLKDKDAEFEKKIEADMQLGEKSDVRGTPTYFLNGKKTNARDLASWKAAIEAALKK
jgi:protein-disulfide isomerase